MAESRALGHGQDLGSSAAFPRPSPEGPAAPCAPRSVSRGCGLSLPCCSGRPRSKLVPWACARFPGWGPRCRRLFPAGSAHPSPVVDQLILVLGLGLGRGDWDANVVTWARCRKREYPRWSAFRVLCIYRFLLHSATTVVGGGRGDIVLILVSQKKRESRRVKELAQGHSAGKCRDMQAVVTGEESEKLWTVRVCGEGKECGDVGAPASS